MVWDDLRCSYESINRVMGPFERDLQPVFGFLRCFGMFWDVLGCFWDALGYFEMI